MTEDALKCREAIREAIEESLRPFLRGVEFQVAVGAASLAAWNASHPKIGGKGDDLRWLESLLLSFSSYRRGEFPTNEERHNASCGARSILSHFGQLPIAPQINAEMVERGAKGIMDKWQYGNAEYAKILARACLQSALGINLEDV